MNAITRPELPRPEPVTSMPTRASGLVFALKAAGLRAQRRATDLLAPVGKLERRLAPDCRHLLAESVTPLWSDPRHSETRLQFGKVENLRVAARHFDGLIIPAGAVFSFWKQLGRPSARRGFVAGRMLKEGCMVASTGGGLCQISNALYDVALKSGCAIVERHAHSRAVPGSATQFGRDATVAWNYVDLRFRAPQDLLLNVRLSATTLTVQLSGREKQRGIAEPVLDLDRRPRANDCGSCGEIRCHRHERSAPRVLGRTAFLLDEAWPEFRTYVEQRRAQGDRLGIPLDGYRWNKPRYAWPTDGFERPVTATVTSLLHAVHARRATANGQRIAAQLRRCEAVARKLVGTLTPDVTEVCVAQSLLPFLWRMGVLGGRRVTVLMTRMPMQQLQARLDRAAATHPDRATLADFRAPAELVAAETAALAAAERIVTPHALVASQFPGKAELLDWHMPGALRTPRMPKRRSIVFPGPSLARKGAYEVRALALRLDLEVVLLGGDLEGEGFWSGLPVRRAARHDPAWLREAGLVVQPSVIEEQPRSLLAALAAGIPVIATPACGILPKLGITLIPENDPEALVEAILAHTDVPQRQVPEQQVSDFPPQFPTAVT
ncbi:VanW family protein [Dongia sedimenti]|uniref:VanW family protein n=1 Tax=Dongia sedimenti TaxID=3064282 RepID=A0ABU0YN07_9PROT|nr:VanW family protein [Rhodospirillaceae bacterium R-7]